MNSHLSIGSPNNLDSARSSSKLSNKKNVSQNFELATLSSKLNTSQSTDESPETTRRNKSPAL